MKKLLAKIRKILHDRRTRRFLTRFVSGIAAIVVFITTYALVLPAITMEKEANCGVEAHQHDDSCYTEELICDISESEGHHHDEGCYSTKLNLICETAEHEHSEENGCYDEEGNLICELKEHRHGDECYEEVRELTCEIPESDGHQHTEECYEKVLTCGKEIHVHSTACYEEEPASDTAVAASTSSAAAATTSAGSVSSTGMTLLFEDKTEPAGDYETSVGDADTTDNDVVIDNDDVTDNGGTSVRDGSTETASSGETKAETASAAEVTYGSENAGTGSTETANTALTGAGNSSTASTSAKAADQYIPPLDAIDFSTVLNNHTGIYYYLVADGETVEDSYAIPAEEWKRIPNNIEHTEDMDDVELGSNDLLRVYLSYTIPAGSLNTTNPVARYRLPSNLHLTDPQVKAINENTNGIANQYIDMSTLEIKDPDKYNASLGLEAVEGTRRPDESVEDYLADQAKKTGADADDASEYISAIVRVENVYDSEGLYGEKDAYLGQDLIFTFTPYSIEKNQHEYDSSGQPTKAGKEIEGWITLDLNMGQVDFEEPEITTSTVKESDTENANGDNKDNKIEKDDPEDIKPDAGLGEDDNHQNEHSEDSHSVDNSAADHESVMDAEFGKEAENVPKSLVTIERSERSAEIVFIEDGWDEKGNKIDQISTTLTVVEKIMVETQDDDTEENNTETAREDASTAITDNTTEKINNDETEKTANGDKEDTVDASSGKKTILDSEESDQIIMPAMSFTDSIKVSTGKPSGIDENAGGTLADVAESLPEKAKVLVRVEADEGTFPAGTKMVLKAVTKEDMEALAETVTNTVENDSSDSVEDSVPNTGDNKKNNVNRQNNNSNSSSNIKAFGFQAVDITFFDKDGNEIEPAKPVRVALTSKTVEQFRKEAENSLIADPVVVHVDDDGNAEQMELVVPEDVEPAKGKTEEELNEKIPTEEVSTAVDDSDTADDSTIDMAEQSEKNVNKEPQELSEDSSTETAVGDNSLSSENEPGAVEKDTDTEKQLNSDNVEIENKGVTAETGSTVEFEAESFSVYAIVYTVDFHWEVNGEMYEFSIPGGGFVSFTELVEVLGIANPDLKEDLSDEVDKYSSDNGTENGEFNSTGMQDRSQDVSDEDSFQNNRASITLGNVTVSENTRKFVQDVESIIFSTPELLSVSHVEENTTIGGIKDDLGLVCQYSEELSENQIKEINNTAIDNGDWALISLKPFVTEEYLTVTMKTGEVFKISVSDNQASDALGLNGEELIIAAVTINYNQNGWETGRSYPAALKANPISMILQSDNLSADANKNWTFEYDENLNDGHGGYYICCVVNEKHYYINVSDNNSLSLTLNKNVPEGEEPEAGAKYATPFKITFDTQTMTYRFSAAADGNSRYLTYNNNRFEISNQISTKNQLALRDPITPSSQPGTIGTWDIKSDGIMLKLFDYDGYTATWNNYWRWWEDTNTHIDAQDGWSSYSVDTWRQGHGINYQHSLLFSGSGLDSGKGEPFNQFTGDKTGGSYYSGVAFQNIVKNNLGPDGFPVLKDANIKVQGESGSLAYLFDDNNIPMGGNHNGEWAKKVYAGQQDDDGNYTGLQGLLRKDDDGYYYYDSEQNYARLIEQNNEIILYSDTYRKGQASTDIKTEKIGLFPFNDYDSSKTEEKTPNGGSYNHQFGMSLGAEFVYPPNGIVPDTGKEMTFEFSGDDDVWVFIDGVLVLDLGGVHQPISGKINFHPDNGGKMDVTITEFGSNGVEYTSTKSTDIATMFAKASQEAGKTITFDTSDYSPHRIDFFYIERGGCDSNCKIMFNLLMMKTLTVAKKLNGLTPDERKKYMKDEFLYELGIKHNDDGVHMEYDDENAYWENESEWRGGFSSYSTAKPNQKSDENHTIKTFADGTLPETGLPINDGQIILKPEESMTITHLPMTDIFYLAEEDQLDMRQFEVPHAERLYYDSHDQKRHEEEVHIHEDNAVGGTHQSDWETRPYSLQNTERLVYTNTLKEKNLDVEKQWSDILTNNHNNDEVKFKLKAWVLDGSEYKSYETELSELAAQFPDQFPNQDPTKINAQWTKTTTTSGTSVTTTKTGDVLAEEFKLKPNENWKLSFEHLPAMTPSATGTGKEIFYTIEEVTEKNGYSSTVSPAKDTNEVYLDIYKFWPDGNEYHDGHSTDYPTEHIVTYVKCSNGKYITAERDSNGEYVYNGFTDDINNATPFEIVSKTQLPNNYKNNNNEDMFDYAVRINNVPATVDGVPCTYSYYEKNEDDEDTTTTGLVMFTRPKQEIKIENDTSVITVEKEWLDADGNMLEHHPTSIKFDVYQMRHVHNWGNWQTDTAATDSSEGVETRTCQYQDCQATETRTIDAGGHNFAKLRTVLPTCDTDGYDLYVCTKDPSHVDHRNIVQKLGHQWPARSQATVTIQPTCTKEGLRKYTCLRDGCGHVVTEVIAAIGHDWGEWTYTLQPTETKEGWIRRVCSTCGEIESQAIEYGQEFPTDPVVEPEDLPESPVPFLPESVRELDDPDRGNYVELYKYSESLETGNSSTTKRTEGNKVYWTKDYTYPKYDEDGNEYTYFIFETSPRTGYKTTYKYYTGTYNSSTKEIDYTSTDNIDIHNYGKVHITNKQSIDIDVLKTSVIGVPLEGAAFRLEYKSTGSSAYTVVPVQAPGDNVKGVTFAPLNSLQTITFNTTNKTFSIPADGVKIDGLKEGVYKLVEVVAPDGYIILSKNIYIKVDDSNIDEEVTVSIIDENGTVVEQTEESMITLNNGKLSVKNEPGAELPSTGGCGTTLFYIYGIILTCLAGANLVIKWRRRNAA